MQNTLVQFNAQTGIVVVDHSAAELTNCVTQRNRLGLDVVTSSSTVLKGTFSSIHNGNGVDINGTSIVELRGAQVELNENGGYGLIAASGSHVSIFGWQAAIGSTVTANGNGFAGIILGSGTLTAYVPAVISASNNQIRTVSQRCQGLGTRWRDQIPPGQQHRRNEPRRGTRCCSSSAG